jgi:hydrogenase maturation protease
VIGVGNDLRGDDAVGLEVVRRLRGEPGVELRIGAGLALLDALEGAAAAILVDATSSGAAPGTVAIFDVSERPLPASAVRPAGHEVGLADALELARALGRLPRHVLVVGVELAHVSFGAPLSEPVSATLRAAVAAVRDQLGQLAR